MRPKVPKPLVAAVLFMAACGEPTRPAPARPSQAPGDLPPTPLSLLRPILEDEAARLLPSFGTGQSEQPLRLALRLLGERAAADQVIDVSEMVREAGGLLESYRHARDAAVDPADIDAVQLLIAAVDETSRRPQ